MPSGGRSGGRARAAEGATVARTCLPNEAGLPFEPTRCRGFRASVVIGRRPPNRCFLQRSGSGAPIGRTPSIDRLFSTCPSFRVLSRSWPTRGHLMHSTWAGDFALVAKRELHNMAWEFRDHGFGIGEHKMHQWTLERPAMIAVAGGMLEVDADLILLGLSGVVGGPPEFERLIAKHGSAFHAQGARLPSSTCPWGHGRRGCYATCRRILAFGSWCWLWNVTTKMSVETTFNRMIRNAMDPREPEEEGRLSCHIRTISDARSWVVRKLGCTYSEWVLRKCAKYWGAWLARHELTGTRTKSIGKVLRIVGGMRRLPLLVEFEAMHGSGGASDPPPGSFEEAV